MLDALAEADVDRVLEPGALRAVFQPIVRLSDGVVVGYEALSRMPGPPHLAPDVWMEIAAGVGRRDELELACLATIAEAGPPPGDALLFVNAGPALLGHPLALGLRDSLPERLVIELTEREPVTDYDSLLQQIAAWRARGAWFAVDDTGSGWSTLRHVVQLRPDFIKLDRSLIHGVERDRNRRALVWALSAFAKEAGAVVIAEGVERSEELDVLRDAEVGLAQGWLFARANEVWPEVAEMAPPADAGTTAIHVRRERARLEDRLAASARTHDVCDVIAEHLYRQGGLMPSIYLHRAGLLRCEAQRGLWQVLDGLPAGSGITGRTFVTGEPVLVGDVRTANDYLEAIPGVASEFCVPITVDGVVAGSLNVESFTPMTDGVVDEVRRCASLLGQRLSEIGLQTVESPHQRLAHHAAKLSELVEEPGLERRVVAAAVAVSGMDSAALALVDSDDEAELVVVGSAGPLGPALLEIGSGELLRLNALVEHVAACYTAGDSIGAGFVGTESLRAAGARAAVVVPLAARGRRLGLLLTASSIPWMPMPTETETIELLGSHAASCLDNAAILARLRDRAQRDPLTGLRNHSAFHDRLAAVLGDAGAGSWALLLADIDRFKVVNDTAGHLTGDEVLRAVGQAMRGAVRAHDFVFRVGGDEFAALVQCVTAADALEVAHRVFEAAGIVLVPHRSALSIGIAMLAPGAADQTALRLADAALYRAKRERLGVVLARSTDTHAPVA
jgi:diguanylate cyclase (GGDEF)-like protein